MNKIQSFSLCWKICIKLYCFVASSSTFCISPIHWLSAHMVIELNKPHLLKSYFKGQRNVYIILDHGQWSFISSRWITALKASINKWLPLHQAIQDFMNRPLEETRMWEESSVSPISVLHLKFHAISCESSQEML